MLEICSYLMAKAREKGTKGRDLYRISRYFDDFLV